MPEEQKHTLRQKAYPSASAFEQPVVDVESHEPSFGAASAAAFGAATPLPVAPAVATPVVPGESQTDVFGDSALTAEPKVQLQQPNSLPVISSEQTSSAADVFGPAPVTDEAPPLTSSIPLVVADSTAASGGVQQATYPSVSPQTSGIPKVAYRRKPAAKKTTVRDSLKSFVSQQQSLTVPIRGIERVAQRQFTMAANLNHDRFVKEKEEAREVLNFAVRIAETMFRYGADTMDVDSAIVSICATYGLDDVEIDMTNQSVLLNYVSDIEIDEENQQLFSSFGARTSERFTHTVVRVVRSNSDNYSALAAIYKLIHSITEKGLGRKEAEKRLQAINNRKKPYSPAVILLFNLIMAASFTFGVGGSWRAAVVAFLVFILVHFSMQWVGNLRLPSFFSMAVGSAVITAAALYVSHESSLAREAGFFVSGPHVVAAGLMMLLPTFRLVSASQDALTGYPLTAAGKFVTTAMGFIGLVVGIAMALAVMNFFDAATMDIQQAVFNAPPVWVTVVGMAGGSVMVAAAAQGHWKNLLWVVVVSLIGQAVYYGMSLVGGAEPGKINVAVGAFTVGAVSAFLAFKLHAPQAIYAVPGIMFLLPGLTIFRGLYGMVIDPNPLAGISSLLDASATILALSASVILGNFLAQNLIQQMMQKKHPEEPAPLTAPINR